MKLDVCPHLFWVLYRPSTFNFWNLLKYFMKFTHPSPQQTLVQLLRVLPKNKKYVVRQIYAYNFPRTNTLTTGDFTLFPLDGDWQIWIQSQLLSRLTSQNSDMLNVVFINVFNSSILIKNSIHLWSMTLIFKWKWKEY